MKVLFALIPLLVTTSVYAHQTDSFAKIKKAVSNAKSISVSIDINQCDSASSKSSSSKKNFEFIGTVTPNSWVYFKMGKKSESITAATQHLTFHNPHHLKQAVIEFQKYVIKPSKEVTLSSITLDPSTYKPMGESTTYTCKLGEGATVNIH